MKISRVMKHIAPVVIIVVLLGLQSRDAAYSKESTAGHYSLLAPDRDQKKTNKSIVRQIKYRHYRSLPIDDKLSSKVFDRYLSDLDENKIYFMASDISDFENYRYKVDDALKSSNLEIAYKIYNRYQQRIVDRLNYVISVLEEGLENISFDIEEHVIIDREEAQWPADKAELDEIWRKRLKNSVLRLKMSGKESEEIPKTLLRRYRNQLNRVRQTDSEDVFQLYMNSFTRTYDPHTQYFSPRRAENFDINMSLSLEGIGAILQTDNEFTKVVSLVPAGPADKGKELKPEDRIVGVGQGQAGDMVDVVGWRIEEVVQLIRGKKGTVVRLEIIPSDAADDHATKIIKIVRNKVRLEEQSAKKEIIELQHQGRLNRIGVITIPTFYLDIKAQHSGYPDYKSTTRDVKRLLMELNNEKIDGLIVDLRENGGGSLQEVNSLIGLFIKHGPTVQVRSSNGRVEILGDPDPKIFYDGPLVVLVNRMSASASEIFAGAIQDYGRGIIIGDRTFGKGTVQTLLPLNRGQLSATSAKFYRISGESTQLHGVTPDIFYPSLFDSEKIGESTLPEALLWDSINDADYNTYNEFKPLMENLLTWHKERTKKDPDYNYLIKRVNHLKDIRDKKVISLREATRIEENDKEDMWRLSVENERRLAKKLKPLADISELKSENASNHEPGKRNDVENSMLMEGGRILVDLIKIANNNVAVTGQ